MIRLSDFRSQQYKHKHHDIDPQRKNLMSSTDISNSIELAQGSDDAIQQSDSDFATKGRSFPASNISVEQERADAADHDIRRSRKFKPACSKRQQLTAEEAAEIFELRPRTSNGAQSKRGSMINCKAIGPKFGVSPKTIRDIWRGRTWTEATKHLWTPDERKRIFLESARVNHSFRSDRSESSEDDLAAEDHQVAAPCTNFYANQIARHNAEAFPQSIQNGRQIFPMHDPTNKSVANWPSRVIDCTTTGTPRTDVAGSWSFPPHLHTRPQLSASAACAPSLGNLPAFGQFGLPSLAPFFQQHQQPAPPPPPPVAPMSSVTLAMVLSSFLQQPGAVGPVQWPQFGPPAPGPPAAPALLGPASQAVPRLPNPWAAAGGGAPAGPPAGRWPPPSK